MKPQRTNRRVTIVLFSFFVAAKIFTLAKAIRRNEPFDVYWSAAMLLLFAAVLVYNIVQYKKERTFF